MLRIVLILVWAMSIGACVNGPATDARNNANGNGYQAYLDYCAGCHETGMLGAPIAGDAEYWRGRSTLWQAVLMEHAKTGYFDMPAKGSRPDLPDATIDAATEYMLSITFPDLPKDQ